MRLLIIATPEFPLPRLRFHRLSLRHSEAYTGQRDFSCIIVVGEEIFGATDILFKIEHDWLRFVTTFLEVELHIMTLE